MNSLSPQAQLVFDDPIALNTANDMLNKHADTVNPMVLFFLLGGQLSTTWLFLGLENYDTRDLHPLEAFILEQRAPSRQLIGFTVSCPLIMTCALPRCSQTADTCTVIDDHDILDRMLAPLSAIIQLLFVGVAWSIYGTFRSVMDKKGVSMVDIPSRAPLFPVVFTARSASFATSSA